MLFSLSFIYTHMKANEIDIHVNKVEWNNILSVQSKSIQNYWLTVYEPFGMENTYLRTGNPSKNLRVR